MLWDRQGGIWCSAPIFPAHHKLQQVVENTWRRAMGSGQYDQEDQREGPLCGHSGQGIKGIWPRR